MNLLPIMRISTAVFWRDGFLPSPAKDWACSRSDIDWKAEGIRSSALEFVAYSLGFFHDGHRAASDCQATLHALAQPLPGTGRLASPGEFGRPKFWYRDMSDADKPAEASWLREKVMGPDQAVWALRITARNRYSDRCWNRGEPLNITLEGASPRSRGICVPTQVRRSGL